MITVLQGEDTVRTTPVLADSTTASLDWLVVGEDYQVEVTAVNREARSEPSTRLTVRLRAGLGELRVVQVTNTSVQLSWDPLGHKVFNVTFRSGNPLDRGMSRSIREGAITLRGLSPGEEYTVRVRALHDDGASAPSTLKVSTPGPRLPTPTITLAGPGAAPGSLKLAWDVAGAKGLKFGVWYGVSLEELIHAGPQYRTAKLTATLPKLLPCTDYTLAVAVLGNRQGAGPMGRMSAPRRAPTPDSPTAAPRDLTVQGTTLTWRRPCDPTRDSPAIGYIIHQQDERHHREATVKLAAVTNLTVSHTFDPNKLAMGVRWRVSVRTEAEGAQPSNSVTLLGPPVPAPTAVYAHNTDVGYRISWAAPQQAPADLSYQVVLSPDPEFINRTCRITMPRKASPLVIHPSQVFQQIRFSHFLQI
jgi:hypothetical protein